MNDTLSMRFAICLFALTLAFLASAASADMGYRTPETYGNSSESSIKTGSESYGSIISTKLESGLSNIVLCFLELPKNVINTSNESNLALGLTGGVLKGTLHMVGRAMAGTLDTLTFPVPSEPIPKPPFVWEGFNSETRYNPLFKMK